MYAIGTTAAQEGRGIREITHAGLVKHLDRFGPDGVMETARDTGCTIAELTDLQTRIDALTPRVKHRKSAEARVRTWLGLDEQEG